MPNSKLEKKWTRWYPQTIFLKNEKNNKKFLYDSFTCTQEDFFIDEQDKKKLENIEKNNTSETIDITKTKEYQIGFKKGFLEATEENILIKNKLNSFLLDFEKSFSIFQNTLYSRLLKTVLIVSSYLIGKKHNFDESLVIQYLKKIINQDGVFLKKPHLIIHPDNKNIVEKTFKNFLNTYNWKIVYDNSIELNSFKIQSDSSEIDATIDARWQELRRLVDLEE